MDYSELEFESASIVAKKALTMLEASIELEKTGTFFYEEEKKDGLFKRVMNAIKKMIEKIKEIFTGKKKEVIVTKEEKEVLTKRQRLVKKLKSNVKNKRLWIALGATVGIGAAIGAGVHMHKKKVNERLAKEELERQKEKEKKEKLERKRKDEIRDIKIKYEDIAATEYTNCLNALYNARLDGEITESEYTTACNILQNVLNDNKDIIAASIRDVNDTATLIHPTVDKEGLHYKENWKSKLMPMKISSENLKKDEKDEDEYYSFNKNSKKKDNKGKKETKNAFDEFGERKKPNPLEKKENSIERRWNRIEKEAKKYDIPMHGDIRTKNDVEQLLQTIEHRVSQKYNSDIILDSDIDYVNNLMLFSSNIVRTATDSGIIKNEKELKHSSNDVWKIGNGVLSNAGLIMLSNKFRKSGVTIKIPQIIKNKSEVMDTMKKLYNELKVNKNLSIEDINQIRSASKSFFNFCKRNKLVNESDLKDIYSNIDNLGVDLIKEIRS